MIEGVQRRGGEEGDFSSCDLTVVVPVYNEEESLPIFYKEIRDVLSGMGITFEIIFVDDGSSDQSFAILRDLSYKDGAVKVVKLSRNFGHQAALYAGIERAIGLTILMMDSDMQHPPQLLPEMYQCINDGYSIVYTIRNDVGVPFFKKYTAKCFYALFSYLSDVQLRANTADFRMMTRRVRDAMMQFDERDLFLRGLFSWVGFKNKEIVYDVQRRVVGSSKYTPKRMLQFSMSGLTSFSVVPLRVSLLFCFLSLAVAALFISYSLYVKFIAEGAVQGWTSIVVLLLFFFSGVFVVLGVMGEYIAKIHEEVKKRPRYIVEKDIV